MYSINVNRNLNTLGDSESYDGREVGGVFVVDWEAIKNLITHLNSVRSYQNLSLSYSSFDFYLTTVPAAVATTMQSTLTEED